MKTYTDTEILDWVIDNLDIVTDNGYVCDTGCGCCSETYNAETQDKREALVKAMKSSVWKSV